MKKDNFIFDINTKKDWRITVGFNIFYSLIFSVIITLCCFWIMFISSQILETSMQPTFNKNGGDKSDIVYINRFNNGFETLKNGDIVIVKHNDDWIIKRVIACKGDYINFKANENGAIEVYVNGQLLVENYIKTYKTQSNYNGMKKFDINDNVVYPVQRLYERGDSHFEAEIPDGFMFPNYTLGENEMFIMGDNRAVSISDSREYGAYSKDELIGVVKYVKKYEESTIKFYLNILFSDKVERFWSK